MDHLTVYCTEGDAYTKIGIAIIVQILEGLHALCYRKGQELSWFCPSVFFYLVAVCPSVWILEIQMTSIRRERLCLYYQLVQEKLNTPSNDTRYQVSLLLELMQVNQNLSKESGKQFYTAGVRVRSQRLRRYLQ